MANSLYAAYKQVILGDAAGPAHTQPNWESGDVRLVLTDHGTDTPAPNTDQDLADISAGTVATSANLGSKTAVLSGNVVTIDAADTTLSAVTGASVESMTLYNHTGTGSTSLLLVIFDTATGLPVTPNGGDITVQWNASGIWAL